MSATCESCVHWQPLTYGHDTARGHYEDPEPGSWGRCVLIGGEDEHGGRPRDQKPTSPRAFTRDGSDYWSSLVTRSDFGCVEYVAASSGSGDTPP